MPYGDALQVGCPCSRNKRLWLEPHPMPLIYKEDGKRPHKCPVCNGKGSIVETFSGTMQAEVACKACKGECVLWG